MKKHRKPEKTKEKQIEARKRKTNRSKEEQ